MYKVYNSDETISLIGYERDVFKFLIGFCDVEIDALRYTDLNSIGSVWSDSYGTMVIETV